MRSKVHFRVPNGVPEDAIWNVMPYASLGRNASRLNRSHENPPGATERIGRPSRRDHHREGLGAGGEIRDGGEKRDRLRGRHGGSPADVPRILRSVNMILRLTGAPSQRNLIAIAAVSNQIAGRQLAALVLEVFPYSASP